MPNNLSIKFVLALTALSFGAVSLAQNVQLPQQQQGQQTTQQRPPPQRGGIPVSQLPGLNMRQAPVASRTMPVAPPPKSVWTIEGAYNALSTYLVNPFARPGADPNACMDCGGNQDPNSVNRQINRLQTVTRQAPVIEMTSQPVVQPTPSPSVPAPAPAANSECGFFTSWTQCLYDAYSYVRGGYDRLKEIVMKHVTRPRRSSSRMGGRTISGDRSKGMCKQAFNDFAVEAGLLCERIPGDHAYQADGYLSRTLGLKNLVNEIGGDATRAPIGTILVYSGGSSGHIEFKLDQDKYCSDYTKNVPIDRYVTTRRLIGAYRAPGCRR